MRLRVLVLGAILGATVFGSTTLLADGKKFFDPDSDDPLHQRMVEDAVAAAKHGRAVLDAADHARKTGDYLGLAAAAREAVEASERHMPSKLDMWEARERLIDAIHESDDETVYSWYFLIQESIHRGEEDAKAVAELLAKNRRMEEKLATEGVSLIPAPEG